MPRGLAQGQSRRSLTRSLVVSVVLVLLLIPNGVRPALGSSSSASTTNSTLTYETKEPLACLGNNTSECFNSLDPAFIQTNAATTIDHSVYERLLWYNGSNPSQLIPWLAKNYTISPDGKTADFTLRSGITFADGNPLNSSAVFFSLNRNLITDSSLPFIHLTFSGFTGQWTLQQLEDRNLSSALSGVPQNYSQSWVESVIGQNFVEITGPLTFVLHIQHPTASLPYLLATDWASILDPKFVMSHDLALWSTPSSDYLLPFPTLGGSYSNQMVEFFKDEAATCNSGITPQGCGQTYLDTSTGGSLAGTGPYSISSVLVNKSAILQANPNYWGGPYQFLGGTRIVPHIQTIDIKTVLLQSDRTRDVTLAGQSGQAMMIDLDTFADPNRLFDVANQTDWVNNGKLVSVLANVTVFGPVTAYSTYFQPFVTNVTAPSSGPGVTYEKFQPFADVRLRMAFADSVDMNAADRESDNYGQVAINAIPPYLPPVGSYNSSNLPTYHYDPLMVQNLLLSAMRSPVRNFHFINGTVAPPGLFNNTFGCTSLDSRNRCSNPVTQNIILPVCICDPQDAVVENSIASTINNVSQTYNMGLSVSVQSIPPDQWGQIFVSGSRQFYLYPLGWVDDYPWVTDFDFGIFSPSGLYMPIDGWNVTAISNLWSNLASADTRGDVAGVVSANNELNELANQMVLFLWTFHQYSFFVYTSNVKGFFYNPSTSGTGNAGMYFASFEIQAPTTIAPNPGILSSYGPILILAVVAAAAALGFGFYLRRSNNDKAKRGSQQTGATLVGAPPAGAEAEAGKSTVASPISPGPDFQRNETKPVFDYLVSSFIEDYMSKRLYSEQSGWRSLIQISEACKLPQAAFYGRGGKYGPVIAELVERGLIETRTFTGQRGRGGDVMKVRVAYDREPVKKFVDEAAMKKP